MDKLAIQLMEWFKGEHWEVFTIFILLTFLLPIYKRLVNADFNKLTKLSKFQKLQDINTDDEVLKKYIEDEIENLAFYKATGIRTNKARRLQIIKLHSKLNSAQNQFSMTHFKRAYEYLIFENEHINVQMGFFSRLFFGLLLGIGLVFIFIVVVISIMWLFNINEFTKSPGKVIQVSIIYLCYGALMLAAASPLFSVKALQKSLKKVSKN